MMRRSRPRSCNRRTALLKLRPPGTGVPVYTGTPVPGGLSFNKAVRLLQLLGRERRIIGFDMVEVCPSETDHIDASVGARILWKLCGQTLLSNQNNA